MTELSHLTAPVATRHNAPVGAAIGVDAGTTNVKAALVADDGSLVAHTSRPLGMHRAGEVVEQDADLLWAEVWGAVRELTTAHPGVARSVEAFGVCSQYSSIVPVNVQAMPVAPMLMWQDQRGTDRCLDILRDHDGAFMLWVDRHGIPPVGGGLSLGHLLYLQLDCPQIHEQTAAYLEAMDYITARATGRITATQHSTYMYQLCDNRSLGATAYDDDLVKGAGVDPTRLPPLITIDGAVGTLVPHVAEEFGIPASTVVYAGTNDTATGGVATAAFTPGRAGVVIGTTSVVVDEVADFRVDLEHQLFSMPGPFADRYVANAENGLGGKVLQHVVDDVVCLDDGFESLAHQLAATEPGAGGVMFLPWLNGANAPGGNARARGGFVNMSLETTRADLVRSVIEGIAHNLAWLLPHVEDFTRQPIDELAFAGGGARVPEIATVLADVVGRPVNALAAPAYAVARATALLAVERHGTITRNDLDALVTVERSYAPNADRHARYAKRQTQFEAAYAALLPISEALNHE
jgi:xylulokinase